ncbi:MAG: MltA domain-containing protein [Alphaproteobacteria bacterium]|nr:MltA domain-containing protein [Alphaproteobacteria bacterium]
MAPEPEQFPRYATASFADLPGWNDDAMADALPAWLRSCGRIEGMQPARSLGPVAGTAADWRGLCADLRALSAGDHGALRAFIESNMVAIRVNGGPDEAGLFTGYFEPIIEAARERSDDYAEPIYALPEDHVTVRLGAFDPALDGRSIVGRVEDGRLVPYRERGEIDAGAISETAEVLFWARDPLDVFILQVQGSGIAELPDGERVRIGFAGHNGHAYGSLGRHLIAEGELPANRAGWEDIRGWLEANPDRARRRGPAGRGGRGAHAGTLDGRRHRACAAQRAGLAGCRTP